MKLSKIVRPEIEIEFIGVKGFFAALLAICKVGIRKGHFDYQIKIYKRGCAGTVKRHYFYAIPKYKFKRVSKIESEEME